MLPKPPFDCDLTPERELEEFQRLKPKLASVWGMLTANEDQPSTSVVVPSLTLDAEELTKLAGASYYEERVAALTQDIHDHGDRALHVTSSYTLLAPLRHYLHQEALRRARQLGRRLVIDPDRVPVLFRAPADQVQRAEGG